MSEFSPAQHDILNQLGVTENGLTTDQAAQRREQAGQYNTVDPPIKCPAWVCCLLPCIKHVHSMKIYHQIKPDDAEVKRDGKWIRYDASSLVTGDIIRMEEGDSVPADCFVLELEQDCRELLVDHRYVTGEESPRSARRNSEQQFTPPLLQLYWGGRVVLGSALAVVTATGSATLVAALIREGRFPPTENPAAVVSFPDGDDEEVGVSLLNRPSGHSSLPSPGAVT